MDNMMSESSEQSVVFLSHGAGPSFYMDTPTTSPMHSLDANSKAAEFLRKFIHTAGIQKPEVVLVLSAHWEEREVTVNTNAQHKLLFDYGGFPPHTYNLQWPVAGAPEVAREAAALLSQAGFSCREDERRGLDHGVFVPLKLVFPKADVKVAQVSLLSSLHVSDHLTMGEALAPLRSRGVLIVGSGFATHASSSSNEPPPKWVPEFRNWLHDVITSDKYTTTERKRKFLACKTEAPYIKRAHPSLEHFLPLLMCSAAGGYKKGRLLYSEVAMETLLNEHYLF